MFRIKKKSFPKKSIFNFTEKVMDYEIFRLRKNIKKIDILNAQKSVWKRNKTMEKKIV